MITRIKERKTELGIGSLISCFIRYLTLSIVKPGKIYERLRKCLVYAVLPIIFLILLFSFSCVTWAVGNYGVNLSCEAYQTTINPFFASGYGGRASDGYDGECTWYAWGRAKEKLGVSLPCRGNANDWTKEAANARYLTGTVAKANSIMVEHYSGTGHVFFVERVANGYAYVTEGNWLGYYHEDAINLSTKRRDAWPTNPMGYIDYIYLQSDAQSPSVTFAPWSNDNYTFVGETNAAIGQELNVTGGICTETGMYLYDANGNYLSKVSQSEYYYRVFFKINEEMHYTLNPGTTYKYKFYAILNGTTYWSDIQSFTTGGTPTSTVSFSNWENGNYTFVGTTNAAVGQEITFTSGSCTETGMVLYNNSGTQLASVSQGEYYYRIYFNINDEMHYTLSPNTTYKYKFYAVVNGKKYWSSMQSFTTNGLTVTFLPWSNDNYTYIGETDAGIGQEINLSGGNCTVTGMHLYDSSGNFLAQAEQNEYYYRIYFKINDECHYTLRPGLQYKYRFYAVVDGSTYWSDIQSFRTIGKSETFVITYDANGGYNAPAEQSFSMSASTINLSSNVPARDGYSFLGWAENNSSTSAQFQAGASYGGRENVTLYAVWGPETTAEIYWQDMCCYAFKKSAYVSGNVVSSQSGLFSEVNFKIWDINGTLIAEKTEAVSGTRQSLPIWYEIYSETGIQLQHNTQYTYQFTTVFEGKSFESPVMDFTTENAEERHFGIDVSQAQGNIDWDTVSQYIDFAIIRCGYGGNFTSNDDTKWASNIAACERLGIPYGVFIYSYAENDAEALDEAEHVIRLLSGYQPSLPVYYDLEDAGTVGTLSNEQIANQITIFTNRVRKAGFDVGVYANANWWNNRLSGMEISHNCRWFAAWSGSYASQGSNYAIWQFTSDGHIPGINGRVDLNYSHTYTFGTIDSTEVDKIRIDADIFPDEYFRSYITENYDQDEDGFLSENEISSVTFIDVSNRGIMSVEGIEVFSNLVELYCRRNSLSSLDVSQNLALEKLECDTNQITMLDISHNYALTRLSCSNNQLTSLDISNCFALKDLYCQSNQLTDLDVSQNTYLSSLYCDKNQLSSLDVSQNIYLSSLYCNRNQLSSLDVSKNTALYILDCSSNQLTNLGLSQVSQQKLAQLHCISNQLTSLNVSHYTKLKWITCDSNQLTSLDVSQNINLEDLSCSNNQLTSLNTRKNSALKRLYCSNNQLTSLDLNKNTALVTLYCNNNMLSISSNPYDITNLPGSFDITKASGWQGGFVNGNVLTATDITVTYDYDCGNGFTAAFTLEASDPVELTVFVLPSSVQYIEEEAFTGIIADKVVIPATCRSIGSRAFANCPNLKIISFESEGGNIEVASDFLENSGSPVIDTPEGYIIWK